MYALYKLFGVDGWKIGRDNFNKLFAPAAAHFTSKFRRNHNADFFAFFSPASFKNNLRIKQETVLIEYSSKRLYFMITIHKTPILYIRRF